MNRAWCEKTVVPALLRDARGIFAAAMHSALDEATYGDITENGLYIVGGLVNGAGDAPIGLMAQQLRITKQAAGQPVDTLVMRGYLTREGDASDRRKLVIALTDRCRDAADVQGAARDRIDTELHARIGGNGLRAWKRGLAALTKIGRQEKTPT